jgi:hypothetical protein
MATKKLLRCGKHHSDEMIEDFRKHGEENFEFSLEEQASYLYKLADDIYELIQTT